jgi:hypothetical protein
MRFFDCARPSDPNIAAAHKLARRWRPAGFRVFIEITAVVKTPALPERLLFHDLWHAQIAKAPSNDVSSRIMSDNNPALQAAPIVAGRAI